MEAVGSRLGRASSRYGTPAVFTGPVRKWKKKWVHVSPSSVSSSNSNSNGSSSRLLLCRWTPITSSSSSASASPADNTSPHDSSDEPPRRKFRYTPIAVLEEQKKMAVGKAENGLTIETGQSTARPTTMTQETRGELNMNEASEEAAQESNNNQLDFGLGFNDEDGDNSQNVEEQLRTSSGGKSTS